MQRVGCQAPTWLLAEAYITRHRRLLSHHNQSTFYEHIHAHTHVHIHEYLHITPGPAASIVHGSLHAPYCRQPHHSTPHRSASATAAAASSHSRHPVPVAPADLSARVQWLRHLLLVALPVLVLVICHETLAAAHTAQRHTNEHQVGGSNNTCQTHLEPTSTRWPRCH